LTWASRSNGSSGAERVACGTYHVTLIGVLLTRHLATFLSLPSWMRAQLTQLVATKSWAWNLLYHWPGRWWIAGLDGSPVIRCVGGERCELIGGG